MPAERACATCGKTAPSTDAEHTLTMSYGWRARRIQSATGGTSLEWRCGPLLRSS
ncbi:MAG: hypothetical protein ACLQVI_04965 [Polyangiaceae bacterium]